MVIRWNFRRLFLEAKKLKQNPLFAGRHSIINFTCQEKFSSKEKMEGIILKDLIGELNKFADSRLAESWDNVGLLIEPFTLPRIYNIFLTNDLTENVLEEALDLKSNFIISYHPPIFTPLKRITMATWKERIVVRCLENKVAVFSPHTSWDAVSGGVCDWLTQAFEGKFDSKSRKCITMSLPLIEDMFIIDIMTNNDKVFKIADSSSNEILSSYESMSGVQCYKIKCKKGDLKSYLELESTNITINKIETAPDVYTGMGRIITVNGLTFKSCIDHLKSHLGLKHLQVALGKDKTLESEVETIAFVPGSGGSLLKGVKTDLYITGEMSHHDILEANHNGSSVILTNHSDSERGFLNYIKSHLQNCFGDRVKILISLKDKDPIQTV